MPVEIHRHAIHLHIEQIVHLVLVEERAPVDRADARHAGFRRGHLQAQVNQLEVAVETIGQLHMLRQARGADLHQPVPLLAHGAHLLQERGNGDGLKYLICSGAHLAPFVAADAGIRSFWR